MTGCKVIPLVSSILDPNKRCTLQNVTLCNEGVNEVLGCEKEAVDQLTGEPVRVQWRGGGLAQEAQHAGVPVHSVQTHQVV